MTQNPALTPEWLHALLAGLGSTPDEVADTLRAAGLKGHRLSPDDDPAARYITARAREILPAGTNVTAIVSDGEAIVFADGTGSCDVSAEIPGPLEDFLVRFDSEEGYRDLAETPAA